MEVEKLFFEHIAHQLSIANVVLFTGAGFSLGARDGENRALPTGEQLTKELWPIAFPDHEYDKSSLADTFHSAMTARRNDTTAFLRRRLTVDYASLPSWYHQFILQPWYKVYTLNVDTLWTAMIQKFRSQRGLEITSATSSRVFREDGSAMIRVIQLNGTLDDLPSMVTFSTEQYASRITQPDPFYSRLISELACRPFIFIGTAVDETPFWQYICLRQSKGAERGVRELRPRSYIVLPTLSLARQKLLADYNVTWLKLDGETFTKAYLEKMADQSARGLAYLDETLRPRYRKNVELPIVSNLMASASTTEQRRSVEFVLGGEPTWWDIINSKSIRRNYETEWDGSISRGINSNSVSGADPKVFIITGTAGDGKTTTAMRLAAKLSAEGKKIVWVDAIEGIRIRDILKGLEEGQNPDAIFIDNADFLGTTLTSAVKSMIMERLSKAVVLIARSNKVDRVLDKDELKPLTHSELFTTSLQDDEIDSLIELLTKENRLGVLRGAPIEDQRHAFKSRAERQLIVALIEATFGKAFEEKLCSEYEELETNLKYLYALCCVSTAFRHFLSREEILLVIGERGNTTLNQIDSLVKRGLLVLRDGKISARHRTIAETVLDDLSAKGTAFDPLTDLGYIAGVRAGDTSQLKPNPYIDLLKRCINHEMLLRLLRVDQSRKLYETLESVLNSYFHFWLQRGRLEIEENRLELALNFLAQARSLNPSDDFVETAFAHLELKQAWLNPTAKNAAETARGAIAKLEAQIQIRGKKSAYPFHILGSQGLQWAIKGLNSVSEKHEFLEKLKKVVSEGLSFHPGEEKLRTLLENLKRETLMLAVPKGR